jgi:hypothetical protein
MSNSILIIANQIVVDLQHFLEDLETGLFPTPLDVATALTKIEDKRVKLGDAMKKRTEQIQTEFASVDKVFTDIQELSGKITETMKMRRLLNMNVKICRELQEKKDKQK